MRTQSLLVALALSASFSLLQGQNRTCATPQPPPAWDQWFNSLVKEGKLQLSAAKSEQASTFTIPVIVHVIHSGESYGVYPNITREQIQSQIDILNADFAGSGFNSGTIPGVFMNNKANCDIVFSMAMVDPHGKALPEPGIERIDWRVLGENCNPQRPTSSSAFQVFFDDSIKPITIWDPSRYFNIWVSDRRSTLDLLGYATFPANSTLSGIFNFGNGTVHTDGTMIWTKAFGNKGHLDAVYNKGRTATHEIGHWLGLRHIWGDAGCGDDYCDDTPVQQTSNFNCPTYPKITCSNGPTGDMFMNFMDYCDDGCLTMFTHDQRDRMHTAMMHADFRKHLSTSAATVCNLPAQAPTAAFTLTGGACTNTEVIITNNSTGMPGPDYYWHIEPGQGYTIKMPYATMDPTLVFTVPGTYTVTLNAINASGSGTTSTVISLIDCGYPESVGELSGHIRTTLSPNPGTGRFVIGGSFAEGAITRVSVYDLSGALMADLQIPFRSGGEIDLSVLANGVYSVVVAQQGHRDAARLVILR